MFFNEYSCIIIKQKWIKQERFVYLPWLKPLYPCFTDFLHKEQTIDLILYEVDICECGERENEE